MRSGLPHQIDHIFVSREHEPLVANCRKKAYFLQSDHAAVSLRMRCVPFIGKKAPARDENKVKGGANHNVLRQGSRDYNRAIEHKFIAGIKGVLIPNSIGDTAGEILPSSVPLPDSVDSVGSTVDKLACAAIMSVNIHLPKKSKPQPEWWVDAAADLEPLRVARNNLQRA